jgi:hypothetical protein
MATNNAGRKGKAPGAAKTSSSTVGQAERRKVVRRELAREEIEFLEAMDRYQREKGRPFPTWSEALGVLRSLGYRKAAAASGPGVEGDHWKQVCAELKAERDRLQLELTKLRSDYDQCCKSLGILIYKDELDIDEEAIRAEMGKGPSLEELIAELEAEYAAQGKSTSKGG